MKKIIPLTLLALTLTGGVALANRDRGHHDRRDRGDRVVSRDHRGPDRWRDNRTTVVRHDRRVVNRRPVYVSNNRYVFNNGRSYNYRRPVINRRYYDYRVRPQIVVENYDTVPGYIWVAGSWNWSGYEWQWTAGHYEIDARYDTGYGYGSY